MFNKCERPSYSIAMVICTTGYRPWICLLVGQTLKSLEPISGIGPCHMAEDVQGC